MKLPATIKKILMKIWTMLAFCLVCFYANAQNANQTPCSSPEAAQFDFWAGDWKLTWNDTSHGTNHVEKVWNTCVTQENFNDPSSNYSGKSWSVYNAKYKMWQQTWVDNQGEYIALTGGMRGDSMVLTTAERKVPATVSPTGKLLNRMVYYHITGQSFDWNWESSGDSGATWKLSWHIHYDRKS